MDPRGNWIAATFAKPRWRLEEVLLWIAYRDADIVADWMLPSFEPDPVTPWTKLGAGTAAAVIAIPLEQEGNANPLPLLEAALKAGGIEASGIYEAVSPRAAIGSDQWEDLVLMDAPPPLKQRTTALRRAQVHGVRVSGHWTDILFDRESILRVFPVTSTKPTAAAETRAERALRAAAEQHAQGGGEIPIASKWKESAPTEFGVSERGAKRVWTAVAKDYPALSSPRGKPKNRR